MVVISFVSEARPQLNRLELVLHFCRCAEDVDGVVLKKS